MALAQKQCDDFTLYVVCLDAFTHEVLSLEKELAGNKGKGLSLLTLEEVEDSESRLIEVKTERSKKEYCFTITPYINWYILKKHATIRELIYVDADIYFFQNPKKILEELGNDSVLITPHDFPEKTIQDERYGIYNVGIVVFKKDSHGLDCLKWWVEKCIEWCKDECDLENERFADQKYLDSWPVRFQGGKFQRTLALI